MSKENYRDLILNWGYNRLRNLDLILNNNKRFLWYNVSPTIFVTLRKLLPVVLKGQKMPLRVRNKTCYEISGHDLTAIKGD